jgi:hypothetical protein
MSKAYIIYQISNSDLPDYIYIGSTENFKQRKYQHKIDCINNKNLKIYKIINDNGGWDCWEMNPIEDYNCETKLEARIREQYWIDIKKANLNSINAFGLNKDKIKECQKEYKKEYYQQNKDKKKEYQKEYREKNKDKIKEYQKQYIIKRKNKI